ncbi:signal peptidase I [Brevundimonas goettingensis]|uniref:Signal peptidase I n=2 Tax=Brevundimonas goettingensis TaxID=2774190 RepID=A0A975GX27_9CAUL|nr:signal peptidase I [Brevundimonas goettingensis]
MSEEHKPHDQEAPETAAEAEAASVAAAPVETVSDDQVEAVEAAAPEGVVEDLEPVGAEPVGETTAAAAAVTSAERRPIWSDHGDAPFEDDEAASKKEKMPKAARVDDPEERSAGSEGLEIVKTVVFALLIAFVLRVLLFQPFTIPSASMEPNLYEGDYIVVSKWSYGYSKYSSGLPINLPIGEGRLFGRVPNRGDIVVFKLPRDNKTDYIKRVIGLPGDKIQMIANKLYINGAPVQDAVVSSTEVADAWGARAATEVRETLPNGKTFMTQDFGPGNDLDDTPVYEVPTGYYFMMGDNRDNSIDSRVEQSSGVGFVPAENLVGKAQIIMFSWKPGASLWNPISWFSKIRPSRFFHLLD